MKFRPSIEIGEMVRMDPPFLPHLQVGQHITIDGNPCRWVGLTPIKTPWVVWPNTCGRKNVPWAIRTMYKALKGLFASAERKAAA